MSLHGAPAKDQVLPVDTRHVTVGLQRFTVRKVNLVYQVCIDHFGLHLHKFIRTHHLHLFSQFLYAQRSVYGDYGLSGFPFFCLDDHHSIGSSGPIYSRSGGVF
ncbi:hypothetical protein D3C87_1727990 [compost metagenome]